MKTIELNQGKQAIVDDEDYEYLNQWKWHFKKCRIGGYAKRSVKIDKKGYTIAMHRVINNTPDGYETDHINGNKLDNRKSNLRTSTTQENAFNVGLRQTNSSGYKGVSFKKRLNKFQAQIRQDGKIRYIGLFSTSHDAARAYNKEATKLHGEFAKLNIIKEKTNDNI